MSENLSIDEIIRRAEEIKRAAEKQLQAAEKSLDEKAKTAIDEVVVDEKQVVDRIARVYEKIEEEEDVKEYIPPSKKTDKTAVVPDLKDLDVDVKVVEDVKVFGKENKPVPKPAGNDSKTQAVLDLSGEKAEDLGKSRQFVAEPNTPQIYVS